MKTRIELKKRAGFNSIFRTAKLQIVKDQKMLTDGIYKHIRHPLYLGEILRNLGIAVFFASVYGFLIILLSSFFLLVRIEIEEKMLILAFGKNYMQYKKKTKKIFPFLY
jgi:protein-S-isoprenylcysteine O-methyltransferase Ste14